jgi:hypothetical protein
MRPSIVPLLKWMNETNFLLRSMGRPPVRHIGLSSIRAMENEKRVFAAVQSRLEDRWTYRELISSLDQHK